MRRVQNGKQKPYFQTIWRWKKGGYSEYDKYEWFRNVLANNSECCCHTSD